MSKKKGGLIGGILGGIAVGALGIGAAVAAAHDVKKAKEAQNELNKMTENIQKKKQVIKHGNILEYNPNKMCVISLLSHHGYYISTNNNKLKCLKKKINQNEKFISIPINRMIQKMNTNNINSSDNNNEIKSESKDNVSNNAIKDVLNKVYNEASDGCQIFLKSYVYDTFISSNENGSLILGPKKAQKNEIFYVEKNENGTWSIKKYF